ncbi:MAG: DMT family transporter [Phycisphaerae bacterium]|nr:DMT family transporter [Phycisphaerae bacterium]
MKNRRYKYIVLMAMTAVLWSLGGVLIKNVHWNASAIAGMRSIFALPILLVIVRRKDITLSKVQIAGAICYCATLTCYVQAMVLTTAANAVLLQYSAPIYVALLGGWLLKEKVNKFDWMIIFITIGGMILFFLDDLSTSNIWGNLLGILSGVFFAAMFIFMRMQKDASPIGSVFLGNILVGLVNLPFMFESMPDGQSWICLAVLGIVQIGLAYAIYSYAIKHVTALEAVMITMLEPVLGPVWVAIFTPEIPGPWAMVGGTIVIIAIGIRSIRKARTLN